MQRIIPQGPLEYLLVTHAKDLIKPKDFIAYRWDMETFAKKAKTNDIETLEVKTEDVLFVAHRRIAKDKTPPTLPKERIAVVYLPGNCDCVASTFVQKLLPLVDHILEESKKLDASPVIDCYSQDLRGRGFNVTKPSDNFNHYTILQDAKDQAALIEKLVADGYEKRNIYLLGYSYGSIIALSALDHLIKKLGDSYADIIFYGDRGYDDLFKHPLVSRYILNPTKGYEHLHAHGMTPEKTPHDLAMRLPNSFLMGVESDPCIPPEISLPHSVTPGELPGRVWIGQADNWNPHFSNHDALSLSMMPEVKSLHFMTAMINKRPIKLIFDLDLPPEGKELKACKGYALAPGIHEGPDFVSFSLPAGSAPEESKEELSSLIVKVFTIPRLLIRLHQYCLLRAERALSSGLGAKYNHATLGSTGLFGWTVKQQIEMAIRIMSYLAEARAPNITSIKSLMNASGPQHSGGLKNIFSDVYRFAGAIEHIEHFNLWTAALRAPRKLLAAPAAEVRSSCIGDEEDWVELDAFDAPRMSIKGLTIGR